MTSPTENDWRKIDFVLQRRGDAKYKHVSVLVDELGVKRASVVPIAWLRSELEKCEAAGQETVRIAAAPDGRIFIEGYGDVSEFDGPLPGASGDPPGWNDDWPEIGLP